MGCDGNFQIRISVKRHNIHICKIEIILNAEFHEWNMSDPHPWCWMSLLMAGLDIRTRFNMDKQLRPVYRVGWNYLSIFKLEPCPVEAWEWISNFTPILNWTCDCVSMLGLNLIHVSKGAEAYGYFGDYGVAHEMTPKSVYPFPWKYIFDVPWKSTVVITPTLQTPVAPVTVITTSFCTTGGNKFSTMTTLSFEFGFSGLFK